MSSVLASRRLRSPDEAFALSQRPLPAHLRPDGGRPSNGSGRHGQGTAPTARPPSGRAARTSGGATVGRVAGSAMAGASFSRPRATGPTPHGAGRATAATGARLSSRRATDASAPTAAVADFAAVTIGATALAARRGLDERDASRTRTPKNVPPAAELRVVPKASGRVPVAVTRQPPVQAQRSLRSSRWKRTVRALGASFVFAVILGVAFGAIAMHSQLASRQLRLNALRTDIDAAERDHQMLRLEVAELDTPEQVVSAAYRLGLVGASEVEFLPTASTIVPVTAGPSVLDAQ